MTEGRTAQSAGSSSVPRVWGVGDYVVGATWFGLLLCLVGLVDGIVMVASRRVASCADGKYFPPGTTDFTCYAHPQAGLGIAVAVLAVVLAILLVLGRIAVVALLRHSSSGGEPPVADQG